MKITNINERFTTNLAQIIIRVPVASLVDWAHALTARHTNSSAPKEMYTSNMKQLVSPTSESVSIVSLASMEPTKTHLPPRS